MTTEGDFNAMLDTNPADHATRGVFGDWLLDRGDPRGEGYIALSRLEMHPMILGNAWVYLCASLRLPGAQWMPYDWYYLYGDGREDPTARRNSEDAAALAFARLPAARRAELLASAAQPV